MKKSREDAFSGFSQRITPRVQPTECKWAVNWTAATSHKMAVFDER